MKTIASLLIYSAFVLFGMLAGYLVGINENITTTDEIAIVNAWGSGSSYYSLHDYNSHDHYNRCKLDNSVIVYYDVASKDIDAYDPNNFRYIGKGVIYSHNCVLQNSTRRLHFYQKRF